MRAMKDSGIAWIGEIPADWSITILSALFYERKCKNRGLVEKNLLSLSYGNIVRKSIESNEGLLPASFETYNIVESGNIVFRLTDLQNDKRSLRTGLCKERGIITSAYVTLQIRSDDSPRYMHYLFHTYDLCKVFYGLGDGVRQGMNYEDLKHLQVLRPDLKTQHRIADYLDRKCSQIDAIIARQQEVIEKLKAYKLSVITEAVTKGLNPHAPMKDSGVEWIGEIPEHWEVMKFGRCATIKSNLVAPDDYADYPQISPDSIEKNSGRIIDYKTVKEAGVISWNHLFFKGQVIYSKIRPMLNKVAIAPFDGLCSADMYPIETSNDTQFLVYLMLSDYFTSQVGLVTENRVKMPKINQNELSAIMVTIPPQSEQETISKYLSEKCASLDVAIDKKQGLIYKLNAYKKSLIYEVVTGKKEV